MWIPQLLTAIVKHRVETNTAFLLLKKISRTYPQAIYFILKKIKAPSPQISHAGYEIGPISQIINDIFETTKDKDPLLVEALESLVEFISTLIVKMIFILEINKSFF